MRGAVEFLRRGQVAPERFLDDDASPGRSAFRHARRAQRLHHRDIVFGRSRQIVQAVGGVALERLQVRFELWKIFGVIEIALEVMQHLRKLVPNGLLERLGAELLDAFQQVFADAFVVIRSARKTDDVGALGEPLFLEVVIQRRDQLAPG